MPQPTSTHDQLLVFITRVAVQAGFQAEDVTKVSFERMKKLVKDLQCLEIETSIRGQNLILEVFKN